MKARVDVTVVGGGPAGAAAAIALSRAGRSVALLERSRYDEPRIGETLAPIGQLPLAQLGVWEQFSRAGHALSPGTLSAWGRSRLFEEHHLLSPYGPGWHLDRRRFDGLLAAEAEAAGARLWRAAHLTACAPLAAGGWQIQFTCGPEHGFIQSAFLVEATGRRLSPARRPESRRINYDRLIGLVAFLGGPLARTARDPRTLVEAVEDGWWYSAWLPNAQLALAYMTDADLLPRGRARLSQHWRQRLDQAAHTRARARRCQPPDGLTRVSASTYRRQRAAGAGWLAAGDAACAYDPLSSLGLVAALESGLQAAQAIQRCLSGDALGLAEYERWTQARFADYLDQRAVYYGREQRWPASPFWQRRRPAPAAA